MSENKSGKNPETGKIIDLWAGETENYAVNKFYTSSIENKHGNHRTIKNVPIPPGLMGQMSALVQSGRIPAYKTIQDIVRDAIVHRLHYLADFTADAEMKSVVEQEVLDSNRIKIMDRMKKYKDTVSQFTDALFLTKMERDTEAYTAVLKELNTAIPFYPEPYRSQLENLAKNHEPQQ